MQAWRSLSRCLPQSGHIAMPLCRSRLSLYRRCYSNRHEPSTKEGQTRKTPSLSETLRDMDITPLPKTSEKAPQSPGYPTFPKLKPTVKSSKSKRWISPRKREKRKRRSDRREAKMALKEMDSINKKLSIESFQPESVGLEGGSPGSDVWKGAWEETFRFIDF